MNPDTVMSTFLPLCLPPPTRRNLSLFDLILLVANVLLELLQCILIIYPYSSLTLSIFQLRLVYGMVICPTPNAFIFCMAVFIFVSEMMSFRFISFDCKYICNYSFSSGYLKVCSHPPGQWSTIPFLILLVFFSLYS